MKHVIKQMKIFTGLILFIMALLVLTSCATMKDKRKDVCPEYRDLKCLMTPPVCSFDMERGCEVCVCESWDKTNPDQRLFPQQDVPPDRRLPE